MTSVPVVRVGKGQAKVLVGKSCNGERVPMLMAKGMRQESKGHELDQTLPTRRPRTNSTKTLRARPAYPAHHLSSPPPYISSLHEH